MTTYIILLRAINVGAKNRLPMKELVPLLAASGFDNIKTILQTGNIVLDSEQPPLEKIKQLINDKFGFTPATLCLNSSEFSAVVEASPYAQFEGKFVHFYFCMQPPMLNTTKLDSLIKPSESYQLIGDVFYLHAPEGIGRSKLVAGVEKCLGIAATGRNSNTVNKINRLMTDKSH